MGREQTLSKTQTRQNDNYSKTDVDKHKHKADGAGREHISLKENIARYSHTDIDNQADKHKQKLTG